jgi:ribonuclease HII
VVACAITDDEELLRAMGVRDSKKLSPGAREALAPELERKLLGTAVLPVEAARLDELMMTMTLNEVEVEMFARAVISASHDAGLKRLDVLQLDAADRDEQAFGGYVGTALAAAGSRVAIGRTIAEHRADDRYPAVGAASILAKVERDRQVRALADAVGQEIGSGYPADPITTRFLREYIRAHRDLPPFCRRSWQTAKDLLNEAGLINQKLEEFE